MQTAFVAKMCFNMSGNIFFPAGNKFCFRKIVSKINGHQTIVNMEEVVWKLIRITIKVIVCVFVLVYAEIRTSIFACLFRVRAGFR